MSKIYKITRVLEHEGTMDSLRRSLAQRVVQGERGFGINLVREVSISEPTEIRSMTQRELCDAAIKALEQLDGEMLGEIERDWFTREETE